MTSYIYILIDPIDDLPKYVGKLSNKTKQKLRDINLGKKWSKETRLKNSTPVLQYDLNNTFIQEWQSITEAANFIKTSKGTLWCALNRANRMKTCKGFIWKYKKDIV